MFLRFVPIPILLGIAVLFLSDPHKEVRLQNFNGLNSSELVAFIPTCYGIYSLKLGDTVDEVSLNCENSLELIWDEMHKFQTLERKENLEGTDYDTLVKCTFNKRKLAALQIMTQSKIAVDTTFELLQTEQPIFPCLNEVMPILTIDTNLRFEEENQAFYQSFRLLQKERSFSGVFYEMRFVDLDLSNSHYNS